MERRDWAATMAGATDELIRSPLWGFPPEARQAVIHERRRRFGVYEEDDFDPEYS